MAGREDSSGESGETSKGLLLMPGFWGDGKRKSTDPCYSHCRRYISILQCSEVLMYIAYLQKAFLSCF